MIALSNCKGYHQQVNHYALSNITEYLKQWFRYPWKTWTGKQVHSSCGRSSSGKIKDINKVTREMTWIDTAHRPEFIFFSAYLRKKNFLMFIYFWERQRQNVSGLGAERERETQNRKQAPGSELSAQSLIWGLNPWTMRSWPKPKLSQTLNWLSYPGNSQIYFLVEQEKY